MQVPISNIVQLIDPDHPAELRSAALIVLGELGQRTDDINKAVLDALADDDANVRLPAIVAAGKLRLDKALPLLGERIKAGGPEAERAAEVAARLGAKGSKLLHELMPRIAPGLRRYIAKALAGAGAATGGDVTELEILLDKDPSVVSAAVQSLASSIPNLDGRRKKMVADELLKMAGDKDTMLAPATEAGVIRIAGLLDDERVGKLLWDRILPPHSAQARANALSALGKWAESPSKDQRERLYRCATVGDFRVAGPALMILDKLPITDKVAPEWIPLLRANNLAARRLAFTKLADLDTKDVAEALLEQVTHPDRAYREEVLERLSNSVNGRKALSNRLREAKTNDEAWPLARVLARHAHANPEEWANDLFPLTAEYIESGDRRADSLLFVLKEGSPIILREKLEKRAVALIGKKAFDKAYIFYRTLVRDPSSGFSYRLGCATCGLMVSSKELAADSRAHDPCLSLFVELVHQDSAAVVAHLTKTSWLGAEELYYLGFHFTELIEDAQRAFGAAVLELLVKRFPRNKVTTSAKNKLKSAGLVEKKGKKK